MKTIEVWNPFQNKKFKIRSRKKADDILILLALDGSTVPLSFADIQWNIINKLKVFRTRASVANALHYDLELRNLVIDVGREKVLYSITQKGRKVLEDMLSS